MKLYKFQEEYFKNVKPNWIYDMDTGTGKTIMALHHWKIFYPDKKVLIVAPASKVKEGGWQRTIEEFTPNMNYEIMSYNKMAKVWEQYFDYFVILDECHRIKNSVGVWGKSAYELTLQSAGFVGLSATPIPNGWEDAINYFKMFDFVKNKTQFIRDFCVTSTRWGYLEILNYKHQNVLKRWWESISLRLNKDEALELPELSFEEVYFKSSPIYKAIKKDRYYDGIAYDNNMSLRHGLRINTALKDKCKYLKDFLEDTRQNVIVFYNYDDELEEIKKNIPKEKEVYQCNGKVKNYPLKNEWKNIKNTVTLANYKSGSEAVEFTYGTIIIYFSPTDSYTEYVQSIGRCYRNGQNNKVTVYKYITKKTIEEQIYSALNKKEDFQFYLWLREEEKKNGRKI